MKQLTNLKSASFLTLSILITSLFTSCINDTVCIKGNNSISTTSYNPSQFESITLDGSFDVKITQGSSYEIIVTGDDNIIDYFEYEVRNGDCKLSLEDGCYKNFDLEVEVITPEIEGIFLDGSGNINVMDFDSMSNLDADIDGSGNLQFAEMKGLKNANFSIDGSGNITFKEEVSTLDNTVIEISGSGNYDGFNLISENVEARIDGSGNIETHALSNLKARISGSGNITYKGNPVVDANSTGSGIISRR